MSNLDLALDHASKGYYVFPAQETNKRPKRGFMDWEANASVDPEEIRKWWSDGDWLPAVAPGRTGHAVIDVDRHPGKPDGFKSLDSENINMLSQVRGTSLSGNGTHFWYKHDVGSLNGVLPSVDRKAQGGYVVVPYTLPDQSEITEALPEKLSQGKATSDVERNHKSVAELNTWLRVIGAGEPGEELYLELEKFKLSSGNSAMSMYVARVIAMAAGQSQRKNYRGKSFPGAAVILDLMMEWWLSQPHQSGDPEEEFQVNVRSAIEKFGEPAPDTSKIDKFYEYLNSGQNLTFRVQDLQMSLEAYCRSIDPNWETDKEKPEIFSMLNRCYLLIGSINTESDLDTWRIKSKEIMKRVINGQSN